MPSLINERFDTTFCINLDARTDRWAAVQSRFAAAGTELLSPTLMQPEPGFKW